VHVLGIPAFLPFFQGLDLQRDLLEFGTFLAFAELGDEFAISIRLARPKR